MVIFSDSWGQNQETNHSLFAANGDFIQFKRRGNLCHGTVIQQRETSVIVELDKDSSDFLEYENNLTVVSHKNYLLIRKQDDVS